MTYRAMNVLSKSIWVAKQKATIKCWIASMGSVNMLPPRRPFREKPLRRPKVVTRREFEDVLGEDETTIRGGRLVLKGDLKVGGCASANGDEQSPQANRPPEC